MTNPFLSRVASTARSGYRAIVPVGLRRRVRARLVQAPQRGPVYAPPAGPRRFELHLPRPGDGPSHAGENGTTARRDSVVIEAPRHLFVAKTLHQGGLAGYEPETQALLLGLAEILRPSVAFDVGANVGPYAFLLPAVLDVPVVAFEPAAEVAAVLKGLVDRNDLRCTIEEAAVGDHDGTATLFISPTDTSTSLQPGFRQAKAERTVPLVTLDTYIRRSGLRPTILKIDTETTEPDVLRGAAELLATRPWIVCEILPGWTEAEIEAILRPLGYRMLQVIDSLPLPERETIAGNANAQGERNWLFAPEAPSTELWDAVGRWRRAIDACEPPRDVPAARTGA